MFKKIVLLLCCILGVFLFAAFAQIDRNSLGTARDTGVSGLWVLANISFAGMRAQNHQSIFWRTVAAIFGFPGTILSLICVVEGSERAYGISIPKRLP
ncbi:MAG TPA: hypothetical protein VFQ41_23170 [Candidatus Angelobacter sp.]|nr:hypothetical protein [Candidatus Angelobacter sp.]